MFKNSTNFKKQCLLSFFKKTMTDPLKIALKLQRWKMVGMENRPLRGHVWGCLQHPIFLHISMRNSLKFRLICLPCMGIDFRKQKTQFQNDKPIAPALGCKKRSIKSNIFGICRKSPKSISGIFCVSNWYFIEKLRWACLVISLNLTLDFHLRLDDSVFHGLPMLMCISYSSSGDNPTICE